MYQILLTIHVIISAALIAFVLLQQGKGAGAGALAGGGTSTALFGSIGAANFMTRVTAILATGFFATSMALSVLAIANIKKERQKVEPPGHRGDDAYQTENAMAL